MSDKISKHPSLLYAEDISDICKPLRQLNISYFAHVHIKNDGNFTGMCSNPGFIEHYLKNKYYNADIHMAKTNKLGNYVIWDSLERKGLSDKMHREAGEFGIKHTFTIIDKSDDGSHFYHFANNSTDRSINQVYITNLDLLKLYVSYFKNNVSQSKVLSSAYDLTFALDPNSEGYTIKSDADLSVRRLEFLRKVTMNRKISADHVVIIHKNTGKPILLSPQQIKCLVLLSAGHSAKQIAYKLNLATRTVNHYLERIRRILGCTSSKELIASYFNQISSQILL